MSCTTLVCRIKKRYMHIYKHNRIEWWSCRIIISPLDLSLMHIIWFKSIYNHMKQNNREEWFLLKKKVHGLGRWVSACAFLSVCACIRTWTPVCVFYVCFNNIWCMCLHVLSLDYLIENLPIYSSIAEMYGSYSSATSSHKGQFVLCKKNNSQNISFFPPQDCLRQSFTILAHFYSSEVLEGGVILQTKKSL